MRTFSCDLCKTEVTTERRWSICEDCRAANKKAAHKTRMEIRKRSPFDEVRKRGRMLELEKLAVRTHAEVGAILGISGESSRQLERSALTKLRRAFRFEFLQKQLDNSIRLEF